MTVQFMLPKPERAVLANLPDGLRLDRSRRNTPTSCEAAGKPRTQLNVQPVGTGPFTFVDYQQDAVIRYKATPTTGAASRRSTT